MRTGPVVLKRASTALALGGMLLLIASESISAQNNPGERRFPQAKAMVEKALKAMQASMSGHLPVLEGFANSGQHPLDGYQRAYYTATAQVSAAASGGSLVRVTAKITAWYTDSAPSRSGYQLLTSNGRLESDLLDQLTEQLAKDTATGAQPSAAGAATKSSAAPPASGKPLISAPSAALPQSAGEFSSSLSQSLAAQQHAALPSAQPNAADKDPGGLRAEAESLGEILKNQAHPKNLVAVKKSGTPVVATPSLTAKPLFLASMHDEFEMLDYSEDWVHVRVSGLSRGWIWRTSLEMPEGIPDTATHAGNSAAPPADLFRVIREETSPFPGDWEPLRGKTVKIISVQKTDESSKETGPQEKLEFAKYLLDKSYGELAQKPQNLAGIVLIFDSADGGMIAATLGTLQQWRAGTLSDSALWHKCFFDPPETFDSAGSSGAR